MTYHDICEMITEFEAGTYPESKWTHESHIIMAIWYIHAFPLAEARSKIKKGIKEYNLSQGGKNTKEEGYHETITEFYFRVLRDYMSRYQEAQPCELIVHDVLSSGIAERNFPLQFYSKHLLFGKRARRFWVEPDLQPISIPERMQPV